MKDLLPGWKTNINTIALALISAATVFGINVDPEATTALINDVAGWLETGIVILGAAGVYFRQLSKS